MATPLLLTAGGCRLDFGYSAEREWVPERGGRYGGSVADEPGGWEKWEWDETLFAGTAEYYERGRLPYALGLTDALVENLGLNGRGRLLDVGCGPGTVALRLASVFQAVVGVDSDAGMLAEAARSAAEKEVRNATWLLKRAEALPAGLGTFSVVTFGASFHWMDRLRVAAAVKTMLEPGGAVVQVDAPAYRIDDLLAETELGALSHPPPPDAAIEELRQRYLGPDRRAGRGIRNTSPSGEDEVFQAAGFLPAQVVVVPDQRVIDRSIDDIVANRFSSSGTARHVFGDRTGRASHSPARLATRRNRSHRRRRRPGDPPASACPHPTRRRVARTQPWGRFGHHDGASPSSGDAVQQGHHGASPLRVPERRSRHGEAGEEHLRSVNDVVMAMCAGAGALRTWLSQRDALPQTPLVAMIPVSTNQGRESSATGPPRCSPSSRPTWRILSNGSPSCTRQRRWPRHNRRRSLKVLWTTSPTSHHRPSLPGPPESYLPPGCSTGCRHSTSPSRIVPGPNVPAYLGGAKLLAEYPVSVITDGQGLNITVVGYLGQLHFGLIACRELVPDVDVLAGYLSDELDILAEAADRLGLAK